VRLWWWGVVGIETVVQKPPKGVPLQQQHQPVTENDGIVHIGLQVEGPSHLCRLYCEDYSSTAVEEDSHHGYYHHDWQRLHDSVHRDLSEVTYSYHRDYGETTLCHEIDPSFEFAGEQHWVRDG